jgi:hypothetical protein
MNIHIIDSNSVMKKSNTTAKVMSNTPSDIADDKNQNHCRVTINYITRTKKIHFLALIHKSIICLKKKL